MMPQRSVEDACSATLAWAWVATEAKAMPAAPAVARDRRVRREGEVEFMESPEYADNDGSDWQLVRRQLCKQCFRVPESATHGSRSAKPQVADVPATLDACSFAICRADSPESRGSRDKVLHPLVRHCATTERSHQVDAGPVASASAAASISKPRTASWFIRQRACSDEKPT